ncbi:hypothetical protein [Streptomyces sp. NPDC095613]|uniref:type II toxin-antitoxin system VapC family toxin n=1 Tax=Streptomyces sp. NPDC095613 TaxID=3155540 RepID=UPI003319B6D7
MNDRGVMALVQGAWDEDMRVVAGVPALIEAHHDRVNRARFDWVVSRLVVEPVSEAIGRKAMALLRDAGLHGHKYAIDAVVAATALHAQGPTVVLTSDPRTWKCCAAAAYASSRSDRVPGVLDRGPRRLRGVLGFGARAGRG